MKNPSFEELLNLLVLKVNHPKGNTMENQVNEHIKFLGLQVRDEVTGFSGVVTSMSFDLYGCIQAVVTPKVKEGGRSA